MASPSQIRDALMQMMAATNRGKPNPNIATKPQGRREVINELTGEADPIGPGPEQVVSPSPNESIGIADSKFNTYDATDKASVFDNAPDRPQQFEREVMEEVTGPRNRVYTQKRDTLEEMDNLFGEEEDAIIKEMQELIEGPNTPQLTPKLEQQVIRDLVKDKINNKRVDQEAKKVFGKESGLGDLGESLDTSKVDARVVGPRGDAVNQQVGETRDRLQNFRREAARTTQKSRKENTPAPVEALRDRLVASPKGTKVPPANIDGPGLKEVPATDALLAILRDILQGNK
jgi:hypothetical protein